MKSFWVWVKHRRRRVDEKKVNKKKKFLGLGKVTWKKIQGVGTQIISQLLFHNYDVIEYVVEKIFFPTINNLSYRFYCEIFVKNIVSITCIKRGN